MYCINCGYQIEDFKENKCPECRTDVLDICAYIFLHASTKEVRDDAFHGIYKNTFPWLKRKTWDSLEVYSEKLDLEEEVNDVLNDIYLKILKNMNKYDSEKSSFRTWFNHVVENFLIDRYRKLRKPIEYIPNEPELLEEIPDMKITPPEQMVNNAKELLETLMDALTDEQRNCIFMHDIHGFSNQEIAHKLHIPENTVKTRIFYGRKALERRGLELKGQGKYVYSISPVVMFLWLYQDRKAQAAGIDEVWNKVKVGLDKLPLEPPKRISHKDSIKKAGGAAAKKGVGTKIIAGITAAAVIGGGGLYFASQKPEEAETDVEEKLEEEPIEETPVEKTVPVEEEGPYNIPADILSGYRDVLIAYGQASSQVPVEHRENLGNQGFGMYANISMFDENGVMMNDSKIQYALKDINGDGYEELLVTYIIDTVDTTAPDFEYSDLQVWTNDGENVYEVISSAYRYHVYLRAGGILKDLSSAGAYDNFYTFREFNNKGESTILEELENRDDSIYNQPYTEEIEWIPILK